MSSGNHGVEAAARLDEPPPVGAFDGPGRESVGLWRDLDSAVSTAMSECALGLVHQVDEPEASSARGPGRRVYQFVTMRDTPVWLMVSWNGVRWEGGGPGGGEMTARRKEQPFVWRARAGRGGDAAFEDRLLRTVAGRLNALAKDERQ
jgi:hypothetical protein